jgi:hypothetical protein
LNFNLIDRPAGPLIDGLMVPLLVALLVSSGTFGEPSHLRSPKVPKEGITTPLINLTSVTLASFVGDVDVVYTFHRTPTTAEYAVIQKACPRETGGMQRFRDLGTLRASLRTLQRFAPWVRRVHIVTNGNFPCWLHNRTDDESSNINLVTHAQIWDKVHREQDLPTYVPPAGAAARAVRS